MQGILSALVLAIIPLIRPYQWQSLLMPVIFYLLFGCVNFPVVELIVLQLSLCCIMPIDKVCFQVLPNDMFDFLDAPVPYIVSFLLLMHIHSISA